MSLVLLTTGSDYAERVVTALALREVPLDGIVIARIARETDARHDGPPLRARVGNALRRLGGVYPLAPRRSWGARLAGFAPHVEELGSESGPLLADALRRLAPTWLLLADSGIVPPEVLAVPSRGTLNAHPALLPWVRGASVAEHSVLRGVAAGATVHVVDEGIDTGPLVRRVLVPLTPHETLGSIRLKCFARAAELLAEVATAVVRRPEVPSEPQSRRAPYCGRATAEDERRASELVRDGVADRLFRAWRDFYGGDELPLDDRRVPSTLRPPVA